MRIVVAGATGVVGSAVMAALREAGHEAVGLSRSGGTDLTSGEGLAAALEAADAVIDTSSTRSMTTKGSVEFFSAVTKNLLTAEAAAGVAHHVAISIIGAPSIADQYYAGKAAQERILSASGRGWSVLRTTQFHEFARQVVSRGALGPVQVVPAMRSQPVATSEVAAELVAIAAGDPLEAAAELAGPRPERMADMVRRDFAARGIRRRVIEVPLPGKFGRGMRDGSILPAPGTREGTVTFDDWLEAQAN